VRCHLETPIISHVEVATEKAAARKLREIMARVLLYSALLVWFSSMFLFEHYSYTRPAIENQAEGRIYVQNNHGYYTYLTAKEHYLLVLLMVSAGVLFLSGSLLYPERRMWKWRALR